MILNVAPHFLVLRKKQPHGFNYKNLSPFVLCKKSLYHMSTATHFQLVRFSFPRLSITSFSSSLFLLLFLLSLFYFFSSSLFYFFFFASLSLSPSFTHSLPFYVHLMYHLMSVTYVQNCISRCIYHCITVVCIFPKKL